MADYDLSGKRITTRLTGDFTLATDKALALLQSFQVAAQTFQWHRGPWQRVQLTVALCPTLEPADPGADLDLTTETEIAEVAQEPTP